MKLPGSGVAPLQLQQRLLGPDKAATGPGLGDTGCGRRTCRSPALGFLAQAAIRQCAHLSGHLLPLPVRGALQVVGEATGLGESGFQSPESLHGHLDVAQVAGGVES